MLIDIKLYAYKVKQGEDCPYRDDMHISIKNDIGNNSMMILRIDGNEYFVSKNELQKAINILNM